jgi:hypothetical protein
MLAQSDAVSTVDSRPMHFVLLQLDCKIFHSCVFKDQFTWFSAMHGYVCGDGSTKDSLIDSAELSRHQASQPADPCRRMSVTDNDAGAKDRKPVNPMPRTVSSFIPITRT